MNRKDKRLTQEQAARLGAYVVDAGLDASILTLGRGDDFCVRVLNPQWHCWSFDDWSEFCKEVKKAREKQRRKSADHAYAHSIDPAELYRLVI